MINHLGPMEVSQNPFDLSVPGHVGFEVGALDVPEAQLPPDDLLRDGINFPEMGQLDVIRYFRRLGGKNHSIEDGPYPLGSCTMKYNPRPNEAVAAMAGFANTHPEQQLEQVQGNLRLLHELQTYLSEITGMDATAVSPMAGAQGELAGVLMIRKFFESVGQGSIRRRILVPDSAHGTNPATATMAGYEVTNIKSDANGNVDLADLEAALGPDVAGMMLTQPSTLGLFDPNVLEIASMLHAQGALFYGDGANMNALVGRVKPGDLGFDVMHLNLHKTFSTPHGGGGPGAAPVCVKAHLAPFLPAPIIERSSDGQFVPVYPTETIGRLGEGVGNFGVLVRAHAYIRALGAEGLKAISETAVVNANYVREGLRDVFDMAYADRTVMHEFIITAARLRHAQGVSALDISKALIEAGFHPPTMYFPLKVPEALLIEPTEAESRAGLDRFVKTMRKIAKLAKTDPDYLKNAPYRTPVRRVDEATAARKPVLRWIPSE